MSRKSIRTIKSSDDLYQLIDDEGIELINMHMPLTVSASAKVGDCYAIGMDVLAYTDSASERTHLAHEIGHCMTDSFYSIYDAVDMRRKHERKADAWATHAIMPWRKVKKALADGITERWELAELFDVTEEFVSRAFAIYAAEDRF